MKSVGHSAPRIDGRAKADGSSRYVDDLTFPGMLHGRTVRSTIPCGRVRAIRYDLGVDFTVVDFRDIPGRNGIALIADDQPALVEREVRHQAEPILLLAHTDANVLRSAAVGIEYDLEPAVLDAERSTVTFKTVRIARGDVDRAIAFADHVVEGEYRTGHQEQLYIEPNGMIAVPEDGGVTVYGSMQCPFYVHRALTEVLRLPADRVRVVQTATGGAFGGKEEYPSMIAAHAALLARKANRPVKLVYDRVEDMLATTKRHPFVIRHRTGVRRDGQLIGMNVELVADGGAYATVSPVVVSRAALHATGPYRCDDVRVTGRAVMTNTPPNGAFRGFGATQAQFAMEVHMDRIAEALGIDPAEIRERNALRPGDATLTGGRVGADGSALEVLREAVRRSDFHARRAAYQGTQRGIGLALVYHGAGFTGGGEKHLASAVAIELTPAGVRILCASVEIGQGTRTVLPQIVAEALGLSLDAVDMAEPDTRDVPNSGPTVASRTCMIVGGILKRCAADLRARLGGLAPAEYYRAHGPLRVDASYEGPAGLDWDDERYVGDAYGAYAWACDVVDAELDPDTYQVRVHRVTAVHEVGRAINPGLVAGQIEGGTIQGIGFGLLEELVMRDGAMANAQLANYLIPTTLDAPVVDAVILEHGYAHGPWGAKGVGEIPINAPAPAVVNALRHIGADLRAVPATPERIMEALLERPPSGSTPQQHAGAR